MIELIFPPVALFLAIVLGAAGVHKLYERERLAQSAASLLRVDTKYGATFSVGAAVAELCASGFLIVEGTRPFGAALATMVFTIYALLLFRSRNDPSFDCGCTFNANSTNKSVIPSLRAAVLALLGWVVLNSTNNLPIGVYDVIQAGGLFSVYMALNSLLVINYTHRSKAV